MAARAEAMSKHRYRPSRAKAPAPVVEDAPQPVERPAVWRDPGTYVSRERVDAFIDFIFNGGPNPRATEPRQYLLVDSRRPKHLRPLRAARNEA